MEPSTTRQLRATLDQEAEMHKHRHPDANRLISGGKVLSPPTQPASARRFSSALAVVLGGRRLTLPSRSPTSTEPEPGPQPPSATTPAGAVRREPQPRAWALTRMVVGVDATGVEIVADLTLYGPDWIGGPNPTVVATTVFRTASRARGGVGAHPPEALAGGCAARTKPPPPPPAPPEPSPGSSSAPTEHGPPLQARLARRWATTPFICAANRPTVPRRPGLRRRGDATRR